MKNNDRTILVQELHNLYHMEKCLIEVLPHMEKASKCKELKNRFRENMCVLKIHMHLLSRATKIAANAPLDIACAVAHRVVAEGQATVNRHVLLLLEFLGQDEFMKRFNKIS